MLAEPLILTLRLDAASFRLFDGLRRAHFPAERNFIPAHVTLFHHLPGPQVDGIKADLRRVCRDTGMLDLDVHAVKSIGRGCAYQIRSRGLDELRDRLADLWADWLIPQDRQGFKPHVTVQNKVTPAVAKETLMQLQSGFTPFTARGEGLLLWRYLGGPWEKVADVGFAGRA